MPNPIKGSQQFTYDPRLGAGGRYRAANGRIVKDEAIRRELSRVLRGVQDEMIDLSEQLQDEKIDLQTWYDGMLQRKKQIHGLSGAIARGGVERMTASDWGRVGGLTRADYSRLNEFAKAIESGDQPMDGRFMNRVRLHAQAGKTTYHETRKSEAKRNGFREARRVLGKADHCRNGVGTMGCVELARMGWMPIDEITPIGSATCRSNCNCHLEYRRSPMSPAVNRRSFFGRLIGGLHAGLRRYN